MRNVHKILLEYLKGGDHQGNLGVDGRIILTLISNKYSVRVWSGFIWLRIWSNEHSRSIKCG
jgi:hypothetical protein